MTAHEAEMLIRGLLIAEAIAFAIVVVSIAVAVGLIILSRTSAARFVDLVRGIATMALGRGANETATDGGSTEEYVAGIEPGPVAGADVASARAAFTAEGMGGGRRIAKHKAHNERGRQA